MSAGDDRDGRFSRLLEANRRRLMGIARSYATGEEAADLFQEMLLQIWRSLPGFRGRSSESTWVYRVALNTAMTYRRQGRRRARHTADAPAAVDSAAVPAAELGGELDILRRFLEQLSEIDRAVFLMVLDDLRYREIAGVTGLSEGAVGVRVHRMKQAFQRDYGKE